MGNKYTPGPWAVGGTFNPDSDTPTVNIWSRPAKPEHQSGRIIAQRVAEKNGPLIAAAPDLLEDGKALVAEVAAIARGEFGSDWADTFGPLFEKLTRFEAAIAKAEEKPHAE